MVDKKQNPFTYGNDPELYSIFNNLADLQTRVAAQFAKAEKIAGFTGAKFTPLTEAKIALPNYRNLRDGDRSWGAKPLPMHAVDEQVDDAVTAARKHLAEVDEINKPILEANLKIKEQVVEMMTRIGIPGTYTTYDYATSRSKTKKSTVHYAGYLQDLDRTIPKSNTSTLKYQIDSFVNDYQRWKKSVIETEEKANIEKDEQTVKTKILGNPILVQTLMQAGVNILLEVQKAVPGKKSDVIDYCLTQAISNVNNSATPDEALLKQLKVMHHDF